MAGLSQGSEAAVAASPKPAVAASPEDLASLRVSQPLKLSNVPLKWIREAVRRQRPEVKAKRAEYNKQYRARPEVKAKRAKYMKQYMKQYNAKPEYKAKKAENMKTATRGGGGSKTATHP